MADSPRASSESCYDTQVVLVHPELNPAYRQAIETIVEGIREGGIDDLAVCPLGQLGSQAGPLAPTVIFAVGNRAAAALAARFGKTRVIALLVKDLRPPVTTGISLFLDPGTVLERILALRPATRSLQFVHLGATPPAVVHRVRTAARRRGIDFEPVSVSSVGAAAKAVARLETIPAAATVAWFYKGVLGLDPDVLVPNLARISWNRGLPVVADETDYVRRGILMAVTHDYRALGARAVEALTAREKGLIYSTATRSVLNGRTAAAMGIRLKSGAEHEVDYIHE